MIMLHGICLHLHNYTPSYVTVKGQHLCFLPGCQSLPLQIRPGFHLILGAQLAVLDLRFFSDPNVVAEDGVFDFGSTSGQGDQQCNPSWMDGNAAYPSAMTT